MPTTTITAAAPSRSLEQRMTALNRANDIRHRRAELKKRIKEMGKPVARTEIAALLTEPPELIETMKVWDLLIAAPGYGRVKTNKILSRAPASPSKTVGGLSRRQRHELVTQLRGGNR
jgi:hypothetical protein